MIKALLRRSTCTRSQWEALQSRAWALLVAGGFGSGKTTAIVRKLLQLKAVNGRVPGLVIAQSHGQMESIVLPNLVKHLAVGVGRERAEEMCRIRAPNRTRYLDFGDHVPIYLRSGEKPGTIDGLDVGWVVGDEPRHWIGRALEIALARARVRCPLSQRAFASTPAMGVLANEFNTGKQNRHLITAPTRENQANLPSDYIPNLRISYSPRMQKALIDGYFVPLEGAVYENLDPDFWSSPHVIDYDPTEHMAAKTYLAVDPGFRKSTWLWVRELGPLEWVVFDQLCPDDMSDWACVEAVKERGWPIDEVWTDPAANQRQSAFGISVVDLLNAIPTRRLGGAQWIPHQFAGIEFGVEKVRTFLGHPEHGQPIRIKFARRLQSIEATAERGIVKDLLGYTYPEVRPGIVTIDKPLKDNVVDHSCDALRYLMVGLWMSTPLYYAHPIAAQAAAAAAMHNQPY